MKIVSIRTVFLSSTGADLRDYREKVIEALRKLDRCSCVPMEEFGARDSPVDEFCRKMAAACDLFIGIVGHRFGDGPEGARDSFTHREYRAAVEARVPRLLFLANDDFKVSVNLSEPKWKEAAQKKFRKELVNNKERILSIGFANPEHLATQVVTGFHNWYNEHSGKPENVDPTPYLEALWEETAFIDFKHVRLADGTTPHFRIDELYTPLTTVFAEEENKNLGHEPREQRTMPLQDALKYKRLVLVGDPGAGKSTFLRRIAFAACETLLRRNPRAGAEMKLPEPCPLPLLIRAAPLAKHIGRDKGPVETDSPDWLAHYLHETTKLGAEFFDRHLNTGCLLLLDGIDEIPDTAGRNAIARLLDRAALKFKNAHIVATSRPAALGGKTAITGFKDFQIGPLEPEALETFVANWCRALHRDEKELLAAIRSKREIEELARNPVMLTALAALHSNQTRLPDQRSELYESVLNWLANARVNERKERSAGLSPVDCLNHMRVLAWAMHNDTRGIQQGMPLLDGARLLAPRFRFRGVPDDQILEAAEQFLSEEVIDSGILIGRGNMLQFWHPTFQEFLAAEALARLDSAVRHKLLVAERRIYDPKWRPTLLLMAGLLYKLERADEFFEAVLEDLGSDPSLADRARCAGLIGNMLRDLKSWGYRIADPRYQENLKHMPAIFEAEAARTIDFEMRLEAAEALGQAGDPRLELDNWVPVAGGPFWMGAQKAHENGPNYDPEAFDWESPVHLVEKLRAFEMGRYPVTVTEYARFVDAGGYGNVALWSAGGFGKFSSEPDGWQSQLQHPNRPVVGVSWYEAMAYCVSATKRLPTEEEWECAARGGRKNVQYPWGNETPDESRANFEFKPGHPTPVGLYPDGATPRGFDDMAGNVYEWTSSSWREDYSKPQLDEGIANPRVIRGGAWGLSSWDLRVSCRNWVQPDERYVYIGFRCVRIPGDRE